MPQLEMVNKKVEFMSSCGGLLQKNSLFAPNVENIKK